MTLVTINQSINQTRQFLTRRNTAKPLQGRDNTGRWWLDCYIWYSKKGSGRDCSPPRSLLAAQNVTAHPSTASVPITVLLYRGPLLCGFNVPIKRLKCTLSSDWTCFYAHYRSDRDPRVIPDEIFWGVAQAHPSYSPVTYYGMNACTIHVKSIVKNLEPEQHSGSVAPPPLAHPRTIPASFSKGFWTIICSTKVLCPQNLFSRKWQKQKGCVSHYVDIQRLCYWHRHLLWLLVTKIAILCNDVNKTSTSAELLAINILCYIIKK